MNRICNFIIENEIQQAELNLQRKYCFESTEVQFEYIGIPEYDIGFVDYICALTDFRREYLNNLCLYRVCGLNKEFFNGDVNILSKQILNETEISYVLFESLAKKNNGELNLLKSDFNEMFVNIYYQKYYLRCYDKWKILSLDLKIREAVSSELEKKENTIKDFKI